MNRLSDKDNLIRLVT